MIYHNLRKKRYQKLVASLCMVWLSVITLSFLFAVEISAVYGATVQPLEYTAAFGAKFTLLQNGVLLELREEANLLLASQAFDTTSEVVIAGADLEDDTLTIDLSGGTPIPAGGVRYEGGAEGFDTISITGGNPKRISHQPINANDGNIIIDGLTIHYSGLEPITNFAPPASMVIIASDNGDTITLSDAGTVNDNLSIITIPPFEELTFIPPATSLRINALAGNDTFIYSGVDGLFDVNIQITMDGGDPEFGSAGVPPGDTLNYNVGTGLVVPTGAGEGYILQTGQPTIYYQGIETLNGTLNFVTDFGDAPDPKDPTLLASDGARHLLGSGVYLGACVDAELDGQPTALAAGDDTGLSLFTSGLCATVGDDENGVVFTSTLIPGSNAGVNVTASSTCTLSAWIDFNADGDWTDAGEDIFPGARYWPQA